MPCLKRINTEGRPTVFPIFKKITSIGRGKSNNLSFPDHDLEEFQAQIVFDGRDFLFQEANKSGLILLNGKKKRRGKLQHSDRLSCGNVELVFSLFDEAIPPRGDEDTGGAAAELNGMLRLAEFNRRLMNIRSVPEQMNALLDAVIEVTSAQKGFIILLSNGNAEVAAARNLKQRDLPSDVHQLSDSILRKEIEERKPIIVSNAIADTFFQNSASVMNLKLSSVMCAPLICRGQLLGLIYVGNDSVVSLFDDANLDMLSVFAGQGSLLLQNALLLDELSSDRDRMAEELKSHRFGDIIGSCSALEEIFSTVEKVATADISVLITGETGTGKELFAREIHRRSHRNRGPFIVLNCGAIPENLMESELFGHVRGAFTGAVATRAGKFQLAHRGTLFLDEIGELALPLQVKLLRALQERVVTKVGDSRPEEVDIRILAATNRDLAAEIEKGSFREDLFYRLRVVAIHLPPLREREDDSVMIAKYLLKKYATQQESHVRGFTPHAIEAIRKYAWPGNIRQLENRIKKALVLCDKGLIGAEDLDLAVEGIGQIQPLSVARDGFTRKYILDILALNGGNRAKTARDLGVDPRTVFRYLEREEAPRD